jgi:CDGSH-type Zn-finger protein
MNAIISMILILCLNVALMMMIESVSVGRQLERNRMELALQSEARKGPRSVDDEEQGTTLNHEATQSVWKKLICPNATNPDGYDAVTCLGVSSSPGIYSWGTGTDEYVEEDTYVGKSDRSLYCRCGDYLSKPIGGHKKKFFQAALQAGKCIWYRATAYEDQPKPVKTKAKLREEVLLDMYDYKWNINRNKKRKTNECDVDVDVDVCNVD